MPLFPTDLRSSPFAERPSDGPDRSTAPFTLVTSTLPDYLNTNVAIRDYVADGLVELLGEIRVACCPFELAPVRIRASRPRLVIAIGSLACDTSDLRALRQAADAVGAVLAFWLHDDPYEFDYAFKAELTADIVFSNDAWATTHYRHGSVHHLPLAASAKAHYRAPLAMSQRTFSLFFCGVAYPNRVDLLRKSDEILCRHSVAVLGAGWPGDIRCARNHRLSVNEMADYTREARLTLNVGRDLNIANSRYALPASTPGPRTFEAALAGTAQLYFASGLEILDYFENETEILLIDCAADIGRALERASDEPEAIEAIGVRAQQRAMKEHTYTNRVRRVLSLCEAEFGLSAEEQK
jgi:spore maturation protein CgeB